MPAKKTTRRKTPNTSSKGTTSPSTPEKAEPTRRDFLKSAQSWGLVAIAGGGITWYVASEVMASYGEQNLDAIGNGTPAIVQIHDPNCPVCARLMTETRTAMESFEKSELQYLVANIKSEKGRSLANRHNVAHVTLLLFDADGNMKQVLEGVNDAEFLEKTFRRHIGERG